MDNILKERIRVLEKNLQELLNKTDTCERLEEVRLKYLGRKGEIANLFKEIVNLPADARPEAGKLANAFKLKAISLLQEKEASISSKELAPEKSIDITMPGHRFELGHLHPITKTFNQICDIFTRLGFSIVEGHEIDTEYYNFEALNIPLEHPSRDAFNTFYIDTPLTIHHSPAKTADRLLLRSHTSPVQIHTMEKYKPPLAIIVPGKVYRPDAVDASHSFMFHQIEGFLVDRDVNFSHLKGILSLFTKEFFGKNTKMRFRPHFFPFTEPSAEVDISCIICAGSGCKVCSKKGWLEILGAGMIHPNLFEYVHIDPEIWTGFAFGMGIERITMLRYGIDDIRLFFENDIRFLKQF